MKKFWLIFILGLSYPVFGQTEDFRFFYGSIEVLIPASSDSKFYFHDIQTLINLSNTQTNVELIFTDRNNTDNTFFIELSSQQRQDFLQAITKYKDWNDKAINFEYKIDKLITNIRSTSIFWREKDADDGFFSYDVSFDTIFLSQNERRHQLILSFSTIQSAGKTTSIRPPTIYIDYDEVLKLEKLFSDKTINSAITKEKRKDALFQ